LPLPITRLDERELLRLRKRREVRRVECKGRLGVGEGDDRVGEGREGRREGGVGRLRHTRELLLDLFEAREQLLLLDLLEVELRAEAVVLLLEVGNAP
jgi:hypothetical protein